MWNLNKKALRLSRRQCLVVAASRISILTAARTTERPQALPLLWARSADRLWTRRQTDSSTLISWLRGREMFSYASGFCYPLPPSSTPHHHNPPLLSPSFSLMCSSISPSPNSASINNWAWLPASLPHLPTSSNLLLVYHSFLLFPSSSIPILIFQTEPRSVSAAYLSNIRFSLIYPSLISRNDSLLLWSTQTLFPRLYISLKCFPTSSRLSFLFMTLCSRPVADLNFSHYFFFFFFLFLPYFCLFKHFIPLTRFASILLSVAVQGLQRNWALGNEMRWEEKG